MACWGTNYDPNSSNNMETRKGQKAHFEMSAAHLKLILDGDNY